MVPDMGDVFPHLLKNRKHALEDLRLTSDHDGQGCLLGPDRSAADRGIEHLDTLFLQSSRDFSGGNG